VRKEYNNRHEADLINPGVTLEEHDSQLRSYDPYQTRFNDLTPKDKLLDTLYQALDLVETEFGEGEVTRKIQKSIIVVNELFRDEK
jgi:hypothetical protein